MKYNFKFSNLCGVAYTGGNIVFTNDGNSILTPIGNRITMIDLVNNNSRTFDFANQNDIKCIELSPDGKFLISVDINGCALIVNFSKKVVLSRFNFKQNISALKFSPDSKLIAAEHGNGVRVWEVPATNYSFCPLKKVDDFFAHRSDVNHLEWSPCSSFIATSSTDSTVRITCVSTGKSGLLSGHKGSVVGSFFAGDKTFFTATNNGALFEWELNLSHLDGNATKTQKGDKTAKFASLKNKFYFDHKHQQLTAISFRDLKNRTFLVAAAFANGSFALHELPHFASIQSFSAAKAKISSLSLNPSGDWLAIGSAQLGQLLVWEWRSESAVLSQQSHAGSVEAIDFSPDGKLIASAGDDGKVKLWNTSTGFCFATFSEHSAPVAEVRFGQSGTVVASCSADGTVRLFDLVRYRCFRVLRTPPSENAVQFTSVAVDSGGKLVAAGGLDAVVYVWSMQTGKCIEALTGHEGPVSGVDFCPVSGVLSSCSWDGTAKTWNLFNTKSAVVSMAISSEALAITYRPDGKELCVSSLNGKLHFLDTETAELKKVIYGAKDILGGRRTDDFRSAKNSTLGRCFSNISYSPDGLCLLCGGESKFVCLYVISSGLLLKKFQISENRSLDGIDNFLLDKSMKRPVQNKPQDSDSENEHFTPDISLPGVKSGSLAKRKTKLAIRTKSVKFCPTGQKWSCASTEGILIYSLEKNTTFAPFELEIETTPDAVKAAIENKHFSLALTMSLKLANKECLINAISHTPIDEISLIVSSLHPKLLLQLFELFPPIIKTTQNVHLYAIWSKTALKKHRRFICQNPPLFAESLKSLLKELQNRAEFFLKLSSFNKFSVRSALVALKTEEKCKKVPNPKFLPKVQKTPQNFLR